MPIDPEDLVECERCHSVADCSVPGSLIGWGVAGYRGQEAAQTCPECTRAVARFIERGTYRRERDYEAPAVHG